MWSLLHFAESLFISLINPTNKRTRRFYILIPAIILFSLFLAQDSFGATITSNTSGNWSAGGTWVGGIVPQGGDDVIIAGGHTVTLTAGISIFGGLTVSGTLQLAGFSMSSGNLQGDGIITSSSLTPTLSTGGNNTSTTFSGVIGTGAIALTKNGTGTLTLSGSNSYAGPTTIAAGTLKLANPTALGATAEATSVSSGAVLDLNGVSYNNAETLSLNGTGISTGGVLINSNAAPATYAGNIILASTPRITANNAITLSGIVSGSGALTVAGAGNSSATLTLSGANTYTAQTIITANAWLKLGSTTALGAGTGTDATSGNQTIINSGGVLDLNGISYSSSLMEGVQMNGTGISGSGCIINSSSTAANFGGFLESFTPATVDATNPITLSGGIQIRNNNHLTKEGAGTLTLTPTTGIRTGATIIVNAGTVKLGANETQTGAITVTSGASWDLNGFTCARSATLNGTGVLSGGALMNSNTTGATYSGAITLGSAASIQGGSGAIAITGTITGATFGLALGGLTGGSVTGVISGTGTTVTKTDTGTWTLSGLNTYTGTTTASAGILRATNNTIVASTNGAFGNNTSGLFLNGGTVQSNVTTFSRPLTVTGNNSGLDAYGSARTISSTITLATAGTFSLNMGGNTAASAEGQNLTLSGAISYSAGMLSINKIGTSTVSFGSQTVSIQDLTLSAGTLNKGSGSTLNIAGNLLFNTGATFQKDTGTINFNGSAKTITDNTAALQDLGVVTVQSAQSVSLSTSAKMTSLSGAGTITLNANTLKLVGSGTVLSITTFNASTNSTTEFSCTGNCEMPSRTYHHLTVNSAANTVTLNGTFGGTIINGNLLVQTGTLSRNGTSCGSFGCAVTIKGNITANAGTALGGEIAQYEFAGTSQNINLASPSTQNLGQIKVGTTTTNPTVTLLTDVHAAWGITVGTTTAVTGTINLNGKTIMICCESVLVNTGGTITPNGGTFKVDGGNGLRTITDNTGTQNFGNVIVASTGNTVNLATNIKAQSITMNGGTFNLGIYNLDVGSDTGTGSITGTGTLSASSPSVTTLRGTGNLGGGAFTFHGLQLVGSGTITTLTGNVSVNANLTFGNGTNTATFDLGSFTVNRSGAGGTLTVSNGATLKIGGTNTLPSNYSTHLVGATGTVEYSGTGQSVAALNSSQDYGNLTISGSGTKTLAGNVNVAGTLAFNGGTITTGANILYLKSTGILARTNGHVIGNFKKFIATGATSKTFEVGDATNYTPINISFTNVTTTGDLTAKVVSGDHANIGTSAINASKSVNRNWSLTNGGIVFTNYSATFTFVAGDIDAGANTNAFSIGRYNSGSWTYPNVVTRTSTTTQATGLTSFSDFQLGEASSSLSPNVLLDKSVSPSSSQSPGTDLVYTVVFTNSGGQAAQTLITTDRIPANTDFKLGSQSTILGTTGMTVTIAYSNDNGASYTYSPVSGGGGAPAGYDRNVTHVRWTFDGSLSQISPNNSGSISFTARIR